MKKNINKKMFIINSIGALLCSSSIPASVYFTLSESNSISSKTNSTNSSINNSYNTSQSQNIGSISSSTVLPSSNGYINSNNTTSNGNSSENNNDNNANNNNSDNNPITPPHDDQNNSSFIAEEIKNNVEIDTTNYNIVNAANANVEYNFKNFENTNDFSQYFGRESGIEKDLNTFSYLLWINNHTYLSVKKMVINKLIIENDFNSNNQNAIYFNKTKISFDINIHISVFDSGTLELLGNFVELSPSETILNIKAENQYLRPVINEKNNSKNKISGSGLGDDFEYFLGWKLDSVDLSLNEQTWNTSEFVPTWNEFYSQAFEYKFTNLSNKQSYIDLYSKYQNDVSKISKEQLMYNISTKMDNNMTNILNFVDMGVSILESLGNNLSTNDLILKIAPRITDTLSSLNIIPSFITDIVNYCSKDTSIIWMPLVDFIDSRREGIVRMLKQNHPDYVDLIEPLLNCIKPNITKDSIEYKQLEFFISSLPEQFKQIIDNDIFGFNSYPKTLIEILLKNALPIFDYLYTWEELKENKILLSIKNILEIVINGTAKSSKFLPIWNIISISNDSMNKFMESVIDMATISPQIGNVLTILVGNNVNYSFNNLKTFVEKVGNFLSEIFKTKTTYINIFDKYENLNIKKYYVLEPYLDSKNQQISFEYRYDITLKKNVKLDISEFKKWIPANAILKIINFSDIAIKLIPSFAKDIIKDHIFHFIPNLLSLGERENVTSITFKSYKQNIFFKPVLNGGVYNFGYQFNYETRIFIQDPGMIQNIVSMYRKTYSRITLVIGSMDIYYGQFWESIIENVLLREYYFTSKFIGYDQNKIVASEDDYDENIVIPGFSISRNKNLYTDKQIADMYKPENNRVIRKSWVDTNNSIYYWKNGESTLNGYNPTITESFVADLLKNKYTITENMDNYYYVNNPKLRPQFVVDPILNFSFNIKINANVVWYPFGFEVSARIMYLQTKMFLPFYYHDKDNNVLTDFIREDIFYLNISQNAW